MQITFGGRAVLVAGLILIGILLDRVLLSVHNELSGERVPAQESSRQDAADQREREASSSTARHIGQNAEFATGENDGVSLHDSARTYVEVMMSASTVQLRDRTTYVRMEEQEEVEEMHSAFDSQDSQDNLGGSDDAQRRALAKKRPLSRMSYLTACVMIKDALETLPEFITRNHLAGVDHFVLIDDSKAETFDITRRIIEPFDDIVTLIRASRDAEMPSMWARASQITANMECAALVADMTEWIAFIDVDEYFELTDPEQYDLASNPKQKFMHSFLMKHEDVPCVCPKWKTALTNAKVYEKPCEETLSSHFPRLCNATDYIGQSENPLVRMKTIARAKYLDIVHTPRDDSYAHFGYKYKPPFRDFSCRRAPPIVEVHMVHYWSGSLVEYVRKIARGRPRRAVEGRTMFELMLREFLCSSKVNDTSSALRDAAVRETLRNAGYSCGVLVPTAITQGDIIRAVERDPPIRFLLEQHFEGGRFDEHMYSHDFALAMKAQRGGFLSHIELVPWVHYYFHGFNEDFASRWFTRAP